jgi:hypothetical protein
MNLHTSKASRPDEADSSHLLSTAARIYLHGCLALLVVFAMTYVIFQILPLFDFTGNRGLSILLSLLAIVIAPPLIGSLVLFGMLPILGKKQGIKGLDVWDDRVITEISRAQQRAQIVILNWPSQEVRTMGVLTASFTANKSDQPLVSVYVPTAPQTRYGYIHVVPLDQVEMTDWTLKQWQLFQLTFGSAHPDNFSVQLADSAAE